MIKQVLLNLRKIRDNPCGHIWRPVGAHHGFGIICKNCGELLIEGLSTKKEAEYLINEITTQPSHPTQKTVNQNRRSHE